MSLKENDKTQNNGEVNLSGCDNIQLFLDPKVTLRQNMEKYMFTKHAFMKDYLINQDKSQTRIEISCDDNLT